MLPTRGYWTVFTIFFGALSFFSFFTSGFFFGIATLVFATAALYGGVHIGLLETELVRDLIGDRKITIPSLTSASATIFAIVFFVLGVYLMFGNTGFFRFVFLFLSGTAAYLTYVTARIAITLYQQEQAAETEATSANKSATDAINAATAASAAPNSQTGPGATTTY